MPYTDYLLSFNYTGGKDYTSTPINAVFTAGSAVTTVNIPISNDTDVEGEETFDLRITIPSSLNGRLIHGGRARAIGKIIDQTSKLV